MAMVAGDDDKVGLFLSYHGCNSVHCPCVLLLRETSAADMYVGELQDLEVSAVFFCERPIARSAFLRILRSELSMLGVFHLFVTRCLFYESIRSDGGCDCAAAEKDDDCKQDASVMISAFIVRFFFCSGVSFFLSFLPFFFGASSG